LTFDLLFLIFLFGSLLLMILKDFMIAKYPFIIAYIYLQYIAFYLTFRLKHCRALHISVLFRFHLFSFLYSIFNLVTGYLEIVRSINGDGLISESVRFFMIQISSLVCAHIVVFVYTCCPKLSLDDSIISNR
jgi:hypothetical protein